jgi:hypothetical protein
MRFYYFSLLSWVVYVVYGAIAVTLVSLLWTKFLKLKLRNPVYWALAVAILVAPWIEELWIAYNFDRLCRKDAGVFINKSVEVDGFYDDTTHWWRQLSESSNYKFVESRDNATGQLWRVERVGDELRHFKIDEPTARYRYMAPQQSAPIGYKIRKTERVVTDSQTQEVLARETLYARKAYWFFIALGAPVILCKDVDQRGSPSVGSIYNAVLKPTQQ